MLIFLVECRNGIQHRKNSWQDGVSGTNCPIQAGWNWTYDFQVKDQIGSFFYFPSLNFQRAAGGYGGITINNRAIIPLPFALPDADVTLFITDWYTKSHKVSINCLLGQSLVVQSTFQLGFLGESYLNRNYGKILKVELTWEFLTASSSTELVPFALMRL